MKFRLLLIPAGVALAAAAGACGNPTATVATLATIADTAGTFALTGAPESGPTGVDTYFPKAVISVSPNHFDLSFDIQGTQAVVLPTKLVATCLYCGALQETTAAYDTINVAPTLGYSDSTVINIHAGSVFWVQSFSFYCSAQSLVNRRYIYSKFIVDSINYTAYDPVTSPNGRTIWYRMVVDPNCGFTGLEPGIPAS